MGFPCLLPTVIAVFSLSDKWTYKRLFEISPFSSMDETYFFLSRDITLQEVLS